MGHVSCVAWVRSGTYAKFESLTGDADSLPASAAHRSDVHMYIDMQPLVAIGAACPSNMVVTMLRI